MTEMPNKENTKEDKLRETEKLTAEAERSEAVVRVKAMHKQIEDIEKSRKSPAIQSLAKRIEYHITDILSLLKPITSNAEKYSTTRPLIPIESNSARNLIETYDPIREDFKDIMEMNEEKVNLLFPKRITRFDTRGEVFGVLSGTFEQERQILAYLSRKI